MFFEIMAFDNVFLTREDIASLQPESKDRLESKYKDVYQRWKDDANQDNTDAMLQAITPVVRTAVYGMGGTGDRNYLEMQGKILAMRSLKNYDSQKSSIDTYLTQNLQSLRRKSRQQMNILGTPDRLLTLQGRIGETESELEESLGRMPTTRELADKLGVSLKQIERARALQYAPNSGSFGNEGAEGESYSSPAVERRLPDVYRHEYVMSALHDDPISQVIYEMDNSLHGRQPMGIVEMAKQLKVSPSYISRSRNRLSELANRAEKEIYG
jgi:DNA-directed RNA polymerase specialized sigma subunit